MLPNKLNRVHKGIFFFEEIILSFAYFCQEFGKSANSKTEMSKFILIDFVKFVWQQTEFAFFGASTSVAASFLFYII